MCDGREQRSLAKRIEEALARSPNLKPEDIDVRVELEGSRAVLSGRVKHLGQKRRAELLARAVPGVTDVENRLTIDVHPTRNDADIHQAVLNALEQDPYLNCLPVSASVKNGEVTLSGTVPSLVHKRLAGVTVWWLPGVRDVVNRLAVIPPEEDSDEQITEACMVALEKDPLVDADQIFVWTQGGVVKLTGSVRSEAERQAAESDVWYVWGVREVINELSLTPE